MISMVRRNWRLRGCRDGATVWRRIYGREVAVSTTSHSLTGTDQQQPYASRSHRYSGVTRGGPPRVTPSRGDTLMKV